MAIGPLSVRLVSLTWFGSSPNEIRTPFIKRSYVVTSGTLCISTVVEM